MGAGMLLLLLGMLGMLLLIFPPIFPPCAAPPCLLSSLMGKGREFREFMEMVISERVNFKGRVDTHMFINLLTFRNDQLELPHMPRQNPHQPKDDDYYCQDLDQSQDWAYYYPSALY